jgi:hypothetical protein
MSGGEALTVSSYDSSLFNMQIRISQRPSA